jgi:anaerobic selenocysteine-containing dehydrogenase
MPSFERAVCPHDCPSACALEVERIDARTIGRVRGAKMPYTDGVVCAKVARYAERVHHPERLSQPLLRSGPKGSGQFEPISWDAALDLLARRIREAEAKHGPETIWPYHYAGTEGLVQCAGLRRLGNLAGWSRQRETFCIALSNAGWKAGTGVRYGVDAREVVDSDLIVIWGGNPVHTQVHFMTWVAKARRARGAKVVVVDPYRTATAEKADLHLALKPGTDAALACAVMHVLLAEGLADRAYLAKYTDFSPEVEAHFATRTPQWAAGITGLPAEQIIEFARLYGRTPNSFLRFGYGFTRQRNGAAAMHAASCLPAVTGAWQHRGGGALYGHGAIFKLNTDFLNGLDACTPHTRILDMARIGAVLTGDKRDLGDGAPVTVMIVQNTNPAVVAPESARVREGLLREDLFLCVHEHFMTDTAKYADLVLPATTFLEHDDVYTASGHTFLQTSRAIIEPHADCRENHVFISQLAERLGVEHPAFKASAWELVDRVLRDSGHPGADEVQAMDWLDCAASFEDAHYLNGFGHADRRFHFAPDWSAIGPDAASMPRFPDQMAVINDTDSAHPFRLVAAPARHFLNTSFTETPSSQRFEGRPTVIVHPATAGRLGIREGDIVRLGNTRGALRIHARLADGMRENTVVVESQWPNSAFLDGLGINTLVSAEPGFPNAGAAYHDTAVWLQPCTEG